MADRTFSSSSSSRKDFAIVARNQPAKLKSWLTHLYPRASTSHTLLPSHHPPHAQIHSQLLNTLPFEIRRQIYADVFHSYGTVQHILLFNGKLTHMRCASPASHTLFQPYDVRYRICVSDDTAYRKSMQNGWEILPLLLSCRQTYLELIEILYSSITFRLPISAAIKFIATVPAPYIALTHLHLSFSVIKPMYLPPRAWPIGFTTDNTDPKPDEAEWEAFWCAFARLRVRALLVEILDEAVRVPEQALLEPLGQVEVEDFEVVLPWPRGLKTSGEFRDAGFAVRRPPEGTDVMMEMDVDKGGPLPWLGKKRGVWERLRGRW